MMKSRSKKDETATDENEVLQRRIRLRVAVPKPPEPVRPRRADGTIEPGRGRRQAPEFVVPPRALPAELEKLEALAPDTLLTIGEVLELLPFPMTRRRWVDGSRRKRYPPAVKVSSKLLYWRARDVALYVRSALNL